MTDQYTYKEIQTQADGLSETWEVMANRTFEEDPDTIYLFTGCGTSYYLGIAASKFFQAKTGMQATAVPASEIFLHPEQIVVPNKSYKIVAISRSGTTSEIIAALKALSNRESISTLAVTCHSASPMVEMADDSICLDHVNEQSVVMTQSFSNMYYALQLFAAKVAKDDEKLTELDSIPSLTGNQIENANDALKSIADNPNYTRFVFLGAGVFNGIAREATLKLKEMTQTECETYSKLEFRHGPISIVDESTVIVLLAEENSTDIDKALLEDIHQFGGTTVAIGNIKDEAIADYVIDLDTEGLSDDAASVLTVPYLQMLAYHRALERGLDPDHPRNLNQVVKISLPYE